MQFDELLTTRHFWEQIWFDSKRKDRDLLEPVKLLQLRLIPGKIALADITKQTRVNHYTCILLVNKIGNKKKLLHILRKRSIQTLSITAILTFNELKNGVRLTLCQIRNEVKSSSIKMKVLNRLQFSFKIHRVKTKSKGFNVK